MDLTDKQWEKIKAIIPERKKREDGRGRPPRDNREVLNGILWILKTGARWEDMPDRYPPHQTCHRRFQQWVIEGVFDKILQALAEDLQERGEIDLSECFIDGTFAPAKKGVYASEKPKKAKEPSLWQYQIVLVFRSPYTLDLLRRMKSPLLKKLLKNAS